MAVRGFDKLPRCNVNCSGGSLAQLEAAVVNAARMGFDAAHLKRHVAGVLKACAEGRYTDESEGTK